MVKQGDRQLAQFTKVVTQKDELRELMGKPSQFAVKKVISSLDEHCRTLISLSPFLVLSTSNSEGHCDASPRGDHPGFVQVLDDKTLLIPERPGNKRVDSLTNILSNPRAGLLFLIPGMGETLRINGKACIVRDEELLQRMAVKGKLPLAAVAVEVEEIFIHCAKSIKRSGLWSGNLADPLPSAAMMLTDHMKIPGVTAEQTEARLQDGYANRLY
ncbi:pyridoxamine 5'-phosphate oxidase family protein [Fictibacillus aquaticus]|uniref:Phosphohydrolase n=1 Tax=Fictibacillus aquaticus TaxID=2021314 RepID=A0A235F6L8_9BACL|nr:pyridoxamine 5'-phosphate oxidase family protein [Fictibacillus aquaticus]OYD56587.1 phosphohydrolase [Fictibacillus aquaticus]